jgi:hypothetical protein
MTFSLLMEEFHPLASDICNRDQRSANLLHGFICRAKQILSDMPTRSLFDNLLESMNDTTKSFKAEGQPDNNTILGKEAPLDSPPGAKKTLLDMPMTRPHPACGHQTSRLKGRRELANNHKKKTSSNPKREALWDPVTKDNTPKGCGYCSQPKHNVSKCPALAEVGRRLDDKDTSQLIYQLHTPQSRLLPWAPIKDNEIKKYSQMPPKTNFICVHGHGHLMDVEGQPIMTENTMFHYVQITCIFEGAVQVKQYKKCFINTSAVVGWISQNKSNRKKTLMAKSDLGDTLTANPSSIDKLT